MFSSASFSTTSFSPSSWLFDNVAVVDEPIIKLPGGSSHKVNINVNKAKQAQRNKQLMMMLAQSIFQIID